MFIQVFNDNIIVVFFFVIAVIVTVGLMIDDPPEYREAKWYVIAMFWIAFFLLALSKFIYLLF